MTAVPEPQVEEQYDDPQGPPSLVRVPYSEIRLSFIRAWGYADGEFDPEHLEILGPSGSGKTYFEATILQDRVKLRDSAVVFIATKPVDKTIAMLGWPVVTDYRGVKKNRQCIFWPQTNKVGDEREAFLEAKIADLLERLWRAKAKMIVVFDEIATSESLSVKLKKLIKMYWREARSVGITLVAMKQRPQGIQRDMHSEAAWIAAFKPKDEDDAARVAQVMGGRRMWLPILMGLDREARELVLLHSVTGQAVITWVDIPLRPAVPNRRGLYPGGK
jgi:KaiC/GvpD/RAD55 family RecA-like ATPase